MEIPSSNVNLWTDGNLLDPFPAYTELRDLAPVVYLARHDLYAVTRYAGVKYVLGNWELFSSAQGVGFNEPMNASIAGSLVGSDPPQHSRYRRILERPLSASQLKAVRDRLRELAEKLVTDLVDDGSVEVVSQLSSYLPVVLVAELVGLPTEGRDRMLDWAAGAFNSIAPLGIDRTDQGLVQMDGMEKYFQDPTLPSRLSPGSWADQLHAAVKAGEIDSSEFSALLSMNYVVPSLDTTINAASNMIWLLSQEPKIWAELRSNPGLVSRAVNESLRLEGPVQSFSRVAVADAEVDGCVIPAGKRVLVSFAAANRDERHYPNPDKFDVNRTAGDHLAFGHAEHVCLGRGLATLEMTALLSQLLIRVERLSLVSAERSLNNSLRGFSKLHVTIH